MIANANLGDRTYAEQHDLLGDARQLATREFVAQLERFSG
jgi:hypothetical protein